MSSAGPRRRATWAVAVLVTAVLASTVAGLLPRLASDAIGDPAPARAVPVAAPVATPVAPPTDRSEPADAPDGPRPAARST